MLMLGLGLGPCSKFTTNSAQYTNAMLNLNQRLQDLVQGSNYHIIQNNGQRIFSPLSTAGIPSPPKGTEIFVGNLPRDLFEDELVPLFSRIGPIHTLRLMLDFFGRNRGYAFISYFSEDHAHTAVVQFNNYPIRKKTKLAVNASVDNRRLFIGNIPKDRNLSEIESILRKYVEGIAQVILYQEPFNSTLNRGFVFVEFESHRHAAIARRQLSPGNLVVWGQPIFVDWAEPLPRVSPEILKEVTKLYLSHLPINLTSEELKSILIRILGTGRHIIKVHKMSNYAFVHFTVRNLAEEAYHQLQGLAIDHQQVGVEWARPMEYSKKNRLRSVPDNLCRLSRPSSNEGKWFPGCGPRPRLSNLDVSAIVSKKATMSRPQRQDSTIDNAVYNLETTVLHYYNCGSHSGGVSARYKSVPPNTRKLVHQYLARRNNSVSSSPTNDGSSSDTSSGQICEF